MKILLRATIILLIPIFIFSCKKTKFEISGLIISELDLGDCFRKWETPTCCNNPCIIDNDSTYQLLPYYLQYQTNDCQNAQLPYIDFSQYTLLCNKIETTCARSVSQKVEKDDTNKKYIYSITIDDRWCGMTRKYKGNACWVLVPKLPIGYTVDFTITHK